MGVQTTNDCPREGTLSEQTHEPAELTEGDIQTETAKDQPRGTMNDYYNLRNELLIVTLGLTGVIFITVWIFYSLNIALNYLLGASTGVVYLRMLAKDVEQVGIEGKRLNKTRLALFIGLIIVATQWKQLHLMPIFLGFLTYKAALMVYILRTVVTPDPR